MTFKVAQYLTPNGTTISRMGSFLVWRGGHHGLPPLRFDSDGECSICHGTTDKIMTPYGEALCLHVLYREQELLRIETEPYRTIVPVKQIGELVPFGDAANQKFLKAVRTRMEEWMRWPDTWITLYGKPGTGKSHVLQAVATEFGVWALYITAGDLEQQIFDALREETLEDMIGIIQRVPILLIDDLGSEHGKDFVMSNVRKIIDFRYRNWQAYPTVVATNLLPDQLRYYDPRIADRLLDRNLVDIYELLGPSWRGENHANP